MGTNEVDTIYCAGGNKQLVQIAYEEGFLLGVRSDKHHIDLPLTFIDVEYKNPDFEKHLRRVAKEQPKYATVPDLSDKEFSPEDVERAVRQAEQLKDYCEIVYIVPKLKGQIALLPTPDWLALAYSIPTKYGGAPTSVLAEMKGWRIHLLGGDPHTQHRIYKHTRALNHCKVISVDGNLAQKEATQHLKYWQQITGRAGGTWVKWPSTEKDQYPECWRLSCKNIYHMWKTTTGQTSDNSAGEAHEE